MSEQQKIHSALIAIMRDVGAISKSQKNQQQGFMFRGIDAVYGELHDIMAKHGVVSIPVDVDSHTEERTNKNGTALRHTTSTITYRFLAEDGSFVDGKILGEGMDSGDKAASKSAAIAHKYFLLQTFLIPTEDTKDPDAESHEVRPKDTPPPQKRATEPTGAKEQPPKQEPKGKFTDKPNLKELFENLTKSGKTPDDLMGSLRHFKRVPEKAHDFFKMTDETAKKFVDEWGYILDEIIEWKAMHEGKPEPTKENE